MSWQNQLNGHSLAWLLESEPPGVRYLALRDLLVKAVGKESPIPDDVRAARNANQRLRATV